MLASPFYCVNDGAHVGEEVAIGIGRSSSLASIRDTKKDDESCIRLLIDDARVKGAVTDL